LALFYPSFSHEITGITENSPELSGRGENENRGFTFLEANIFYGGVGNGMVNPTADSFFWGFEWLQTLEPYSAHTNACGSV